MHNLNLWNILFVLLIVHSATASSVLFYGDSITAFGEKADGYVELIREEAPSGLDVLSSGVPGNKIGDLLARYEQDVVPHSPDLVFIWIGVNDVWHWDALYTSQGKQGTSAKDFTEGLSQLITRARADGAKVILCTPAVIGERKDNHQDAMLDDYSQIIRDLGHKYDVPVIDFRAAFKNYLRLYNPENLAEGILTKDGVHLNDRGNRFVADLIMPYLPTKAPGEIKTIATSLSDDTIEASAVFVENGDPVSVLYEGSSWQETSGSLVASGTKRVLYGGESLGAGDVEVRVRLALNGIQGSAASLVIDGSHFGFSAANGRMFIEGPVFGGSRQLASWKDFIQEGVPFELVVLRVGPEIIVSIDGKEVVRAPERRAASDFGPVGLRPWRATMRVMDFSVVGALAPGRVGENRMPGPIRPLDVPRIDLSRDPSIRTVVDQGSSSQYKGHPTTVRLADGTILTTYPLGHGGPDVVLRHSSDRGRTWSEPHELPANWAESTNCPSIYELTDPEGTTRLFVFEGRYGMRQAHSEDGGETWTPMEPNGLPSIMPFTAILPLKDGRLLGAWNVGRGSWLSESSDGGLSWGPPREVARANEQFPEAFPVEPFLLRSPDDNEIAMILRENARRYNSLVMFSQDEGQTWSEMQELSRELTGDRHIGGYLPDGRLFLGMRDTTPGSEDFGHYVGWLGNYEDLKTGGAGLARFKLLHNYDKYDSGYSGVEIFPDGEVVATTYGDINPGPERQSVVSIYFDPAKVLEELD